MGTNTLVSDEVLSVGDVFEITNKDTPPWAKGPFRVTHIIENGYYKVERVAKPIVEELEHPFL